MEELRRTFRPEFLNRVDEIVVFHQLGRDEIDRIVDLQLARLRKLLRDRELDIELTPRGAHLPGRRGLRPAPTGPGRSSGPSCATSRTRWPRRSSRATFAPATSSWSDAQGRRADASRAAGRGAETAADGH